MRLRCADPRSRDPRSRGARCDVLSRPVSTWPESESRVNARQKPLPSRSRMQSGGSHRTGAHSDGNPPRPPSARIEVRGDAGVRDPIRAARRFHPGVRKPSPGRRRLRSFARNERQRDRATQCRQRCVEGCALYRTGTGNRTLSRSPVSALATGAHPDAWRSEGAHGTADGADEAGNG